MIQTAFIGAGALAGTLAPALEEKGYAVKYVAARTQEAAARLAGRLSGAVATTELATVQADFYIIAVNDTEIEAVVQALPRRETAVYAHTSGATSIDVLKPLGDNIGVFYPLQTFTRGRAVDWAKIPVFIEAANGIALGRLETASYALTRKVKRMDSRDRFRLHAGAIFASNFVNYLLGAADSVAASIGMDYTVYLPILQEVVAKLYELPPTEAQTGPAKRGDWEVVERHTSYLTEIDPDLAHLYVLLSQSIAAHYH